MTITMKNYVFKIFYFFVLMPSLLLFDRSEFWSLKYLKYQHQYKKNVIKIPWLFHYGGFCLVPTSNSIYHKISYNLLNKTFLDFSQNFGLGLWHVMALSTIFLLYQFYWWRKLEFRRKPQSSHNHWQTLSYNVVSNTPSHE